MLRQSANSGNDSLSPLSKIVLFDVLEHVFSIYLTPFTKKHLLQVMTILLDLPVCFLPVKMLRIPLASMVTVTLIWEILRWVRRTFRFAIIAICVTGVSGTGCSDSGSRWIKLLQAKENLRAVRILSTPDGPLSSGLGAREALCHSWQLKLKEN